MNGIGLLVLIAAAGQIGATPQIVPNNSFGWQFDQINPDRALCFIVQVSPEVAATMQRTAHERPADMPPELVGRATRIVFRIGNDLLPQDPPLEELRKMPIVNSSANVTAQLGGGRMTDVEPNDVVNVQQDRTGAPKLPAYPSQSPTNAPQPPTDFSNRLQQGAENLVDQARNLARGTQGLPPNPSGRATGSGSPMPDYSATGNSSRLGSSPPDNNFNPPQRELANTATNIDANGWPRSQPTIGGTPGGDRNRDDASRIADNRFGNPNTAGAAGSFAGNNGGAIPASGYGQTGYDPNYGSPNPPSLGPQEMFTRIAPIQTPSNGFGSYPGNQGQGKFNSGTPGSNSNPGQSQFGPGQFTQNGQGYGDGRYPPPLNAPQGSNPPYVNHGQGGNDDFGRIAANPIGGGQNTSLPASNDPSGQGASRPGAAGGAGRGNSPSDETKEASAGANKSTAFENILPAFFILSLLVNFYLGSLIRKLLTRYRALLANMRGQSSPNVLGA
ncbi:MAG: hypothetical protein R3C56_17555 [Pirellulaceae bacterium]